MLLWTWFSFTNGVVGLSIVAVVFVVEVGHVAICCFVLVLWLKDFQLLHEELLGISVLCYVLPR